MMEMKANEMQWNAMELVKKKSKLDISTLKHQLLGRRGDV